MSHKDFNEKLEYISKRYADKTSMVYMTENLGDVRFSFSDIYNLIIETQSVLKKSGIVCGDRAAIITPHSPFGVMAGLALAYSNITAVMIDASLPIEEICRLLEFSDVRALFTTNVLYDKISHELTQNIPCFELGKDNTVNKFISGSVETVSMPETVDRDTDVIAIIFSSGTTDKMKGIMVTYKSMLLSHRYLSDVFGLSRGKRYLLVLPFYHISGYDSSFVFFLSGCSLGFIENLSSSKLQNALLKYNPHYFAMIPKVYDIIAEKIINTVYSKGKIFKGLFEKTLKISIDLRKKFGIKIGKIIFKPIYNKAFGKNICGLSILGAKCKTETADLFLGFGIEWANLYATTETNAPISSTGIYDKYPLNSVGCISQFDDIKVLINNSDNDGIGEVYVKSSLIMKGYFREPELTANAFDNGYFKTGDLGYLDKNYYLYLTGRNKDSIILHNGKKVSAADIDEFYQILCPNVNIASCGVENSDGYDDVYLFVEKLTHSENIIQSAINSIIQKSSQTNSLYKISKVLTIDKIPATSIGKVKRYLLKEYAKASSCTNVDVNNNCEIKKLSNIEIVINAIKTLSSVQFKNITENTKLIDDLSLDSLSLFELCAEIENSTGINISDKMYGISTVNDIAKLLDNPIENYKKSNYDIQKFPLPKNESNIKQIARFKSITETTYNFKITGTENISQKTKYIFCPNHESYFDAMWVAAALYKHDFDVRILCSMAAEHLMNNWLMKKAFVALGGIPVDRTGNTAPAIERALQCLCNDKCLMLIHPEGTRTRTGKLGEFKQGAAKLSIESGVKIIPVCIDGAYEIFPPNRKLPRLFDWKHFSKYPLRIQFGTPIEPKEKNAAEITKEIKRQITEMKGDYMNSVMEKNQNNTEEVGTDVNTGNNNNDKEIIDYLLKIHSTMQNIVIKSEDRSIGATNVAAIVAILGIFVSNMDKESNSIFYCLLFPIGVLAVLSIYTYHNRISAILRGYLAGIEDVLAQKIGKNIFIFNRGYVPLYHAPHFITNDIMGGMFMFIGLLGVIYSFYRIIVESVLPFPLLIIYIVSFLLFSGIYTYEMLTNGDIKKKSRKYFHIAYEQGNIDPKINSADFKNYRYD